MISHALKFFFVHIPKTGGTSLAYLLHRHCENVVKHQFAADLMQECRGAVDYFRFTVIRNPWEREVSRYCFQKQNPSLATHQEANRLSFKEWLRSRHNDTEFMMFYGAPMLDWIADKEGNLLVDYIARLERIHRDWEIISDALKIDGVLPWLNRSEHSDYAEFYDDESRAMVGDVYAKDIEFFDYEF